VSQEAIVKRYQEGAAATCYVNPEDPARAVLVRRTGSGLLRILIPLLFMVVGVVGVLKAKEWGKRMTAAQKKAEGEG
jgi:hypothetical protein